MFIGFSKYFVDVYMYIYSMFYLTDKDQNIIAFFIKVFCPICKAKKKRGT